MTDKDYWAWAYSLSKVGNKEASQSIVSQLSSDTSATAYYWQYERSAANSPGSRPSNARKWYNYLSGQAYNPITPNTYQANPFFTMGTSAQSKNFPIGNKYPSGKKQYKIFERFQRKLSIESCLWSPKEY